MARTGLLTDVPAVESPATIERDVDQSPENDAGVIPGKEHAGSVSVPFPRGESRVQCAMGYTPRPGCRCPERSRR
jgi:hypothetical protein